MYLDRPTLHTGSGLECEGHGLAFQVPIGGASLSHNICSTGSRRRGCCPTGQGNCCVSRRQRGECGFSHPPTAPVSWSRSSWLA